VSNYTLTIFKKTYILDKIIIGDGPMKKKRLENIITGTLLCIICLFAIGFVLLNQTIDNKTTEVAVIDKWDIKIIDISNVKEKDKEINVSTAKLNLDIKPGIQTYNITLENKGTIPGILTEYNVFTNNENIISNINSNIGTILKENDTLTFKLTLDNKTKKTYKNEEIIINFDFKQNKNISKKVYTNLNNIIYNNLNKSIKEINNTYYFKSEDPDNYIIFSNKCYRIMSLNNNKVKLIYSNEIEDNKCSNKKVLINKNNFTNTLDIMNYLVKTSSTGKLSNNYIFTKEDLNNMESIKYSYKDLFTNEVNTFESKIGILNIKDYQKDMPYLINTLDYTLEYNSFDNTYLANDKNYYNYETNNNITPVIIVKNVNKLTGKGTKDNPYIIEK